MTHLPPYMTGGEIMIRPCQRGSARAILRHSNFPQDADAAAMMAPLPPPPVRLDVRLEGGRAVGYPINGEFLVGSATGCDLRLPGTNLPPVIGQFNRQGDTLSFRRLAPTATISLNDTAISNDSVHDL